MTAQRSNAVRGLHQSPFTGHRPPSRPSTVPTGYRLPATVQWVYWPPEPRVVEQIRDEIGDEESPAKPEIGCAAHHGEQARVGAGDR